MLEERYEKSEAGRAEIKTRALVQGRIARNLLLVIDPTKTGGQWLGMVQGATQADLALLLQHGLVAPAAGVARAVAASSGAAAASAGSPPSRSAGSLSVSSPAPSSTVPPGSVPTASRPMPVTGTRPMGAPVSSLDFQQLYTALTVFAKQQGLLKGYRLALEVEQCADFEQLQTLALDVVDRIRATKGDAAAHELRETLGFN